MRSLFGAADISLEDKNTSLEFPQSIPATNDKAGKPLIHNNLPAPEDGRRDWTRTNDPHHVKVVL